MSELLPSIEDRSAWQCPEHGAGTPLRLFGKTLHCVLCGDQCEPRPSVLAALKHAARPDVIEPEAAPVRGAPPALYGCHNRPDRTPPYFAQNGYGEGKFKGEQHMGDGNWLRQPVYKKVLNVMSKDCRYDKSSTDAKCAGCNHNKPGNKA